MLPSFRVSARNASSAVHRVRATLMIVATTLGGCAALFPFLTGPIDGDASSSTVFNNTTDKTNNNAKYLTSAACRACHPDKDAAQSIHGHAFMLNRIEGAAPEYDPVAPRAGTPDPPSGFSWSEISWVIGGYLKQARFVDQDGFALTTGLEGVPTQWNLDFPTNGTHAGFVNYDADRKDPKPYGFSCFQCHVTGAMPVNPDAPRFQENRPGLQGTWAEAGVQCEACHGPGSNHVPNPAARNIFVDFTGSQSCNLCHARPYGSTSGEILAANGFIRHEQQRSELSASGGHSQFACIMCHDPHHSVTFDRDNAIINDCTACHADQTMALHSGKVFVRGDYTETLRCESCHMTFATKSASTASSAVVGDVGRMGDTHTHIFRINPDGSDYTTMFSADGTQVIRDDQGRAAVTLDFVCLRCHNGLGSAFELSLTDVSQIAPTIHAAN